MIIKGKLTLNSEGTLCLRTNLAQGGAKFITDIELKELLEDFIDKEIMIELLEIKKWEEN